GVGPVEPLEGGDDHASVARVDAHSTGGVGFASLDDVHGLERSEGVAFDPQVDLVPLCGRTRQVHGLDDDGLLPVPAGSAHSSSQPVAMNTLSAVLRTDSTKSSALMTLPP